MTDKQRKTSPRPSVADFLAEAIFSGRYQPGDFVPKEVDLCEQFAINRSAVRSDLRQTMTASRPCATGPVSGACSSIPSSRRR